MLQKLVIRNYAIIDKLTMEPGRGLNTITGETGAGKSIILGALSLILGERADTSVLINKEERSIVEGYFDVAGNETFRMALEKADLDHEPQCIIRREIAASGKSRAFVNDTPVNLQTLNELTSLLVDLQQQFGHLALEEDGFQVETLDAVAGTLELSARYAGTYARWKNISRQLAEKKATQARQKQEADYKQYLLDELAQAAFAPDEIEHAELQLKQMTHAERILNVLQTAQYALTEGEQPLVNELRRLSQQMQGITDVFADVAPLQERTASVWAELKDIAAELEILQGKVALDTAAMEELQGRIDLGNKLLKKHALRTTTELIVLQQQLEDELGATAALDGSIVQLEAETEALYKEVAAMAAELSAGRTAAIPAFTARINELLALVGMPNARFDVRISPTQPGMYGTDKVEFLLDANKSGNMQLLHKAASGGEMSRIMLCIKSMVASALHLPTLIFDEVDTGISGEAARQVGVLLRDLSQYHQVICITHQPQVAARGTQHYYVYKDAGENGRIATRIKLLVEEERVLAIARMIGGEQPTGSAISNARELMADGA
ncbi:DNA repair protein RecN [Nemorincola caseinilytica]|uniref:DNA repair protein RecN n=1 Tax=Nemorincola caseinilytica TaxID=2054315 RepID=A0ABP8N293_9BACT